MTPNEIINRLKAALEKAKFKVYEDDADIREKHAFPGAAITYILHDQVELYLAEGTRTDGEGNMAADVAAQAIQAAGLRIPQGGDPSNELLVGRIIVTA